MIRTPDGREHPVVLEGADMEENVGDTLFSTFRPFLVMKTKDAKHLERETQLDIYCDGAWKNWAISEIRNQGIGLTVLELSYAPAI